MLYNPSVLCAFFTNSELLAAVTRDSITYTNVYKANDVTVYPMNIRTMADDFVPIGYVKTFCKSKIVGTPPYVLSYSPKLKHMNLHGQWLPLFNEPSTDINVSMYKELLKHDEATAVYKDADGNLQFI